MIDGFSLLCWYDVDNHSILTDQLSTNCIPRCMQSQYFLMYTFKDIHNGLGFLNSSIPPHFPPSCTAHICIVRLQTKQVLWRDYIFLSYSRAQVDADTQSNTSPLPRRSCRSAAQMLKLWQGLGLYVRVLMLPHGAALMFSGALHWHLRKINKIMQFHLNRRCYNCICLALRDRFKWLVINLSL